MILKKQLHTDSIIMKKSVSFLFILSLLLLLVYVPAGFSAEEVQETPNLDKIADDMKYLNGVGFIKLGKVDKAIEELNEYLEIYHDGIHRGEALMNIGNIYFRNFQYQKAQKIYRRLYEEYSDSDEGVSGYYKVAICYSKMGYDKQAMEVFRQIIKEHAASSYAAQAMLQLDLLDIVNE